MEIRPFQKVWVVKQTTGNDSKRSMLLSKVVQTPPDHSKLWAIASHRDRKGVRMGLSIVRGPIWPISRYLPPIKLALMTGDKPVCPE